MNLHPRPNTAGFRDLQLIQEIIRPENPCPPESDHDFLVQNHRPDLLEILRQENALRALDLP